MDDRDLQMMTREQHAALPEHEPACLSDQVLESFEAPPRERIASNLEEMRRLAHNNGEIARDDGDAELYLRFSRMVGELDGLRVVLVEGKGRG